MSMRFPSQVSEGHRFLLVARLVERKNIPAAILAFSQIADPSDTFTIVGEGPLRVVIQEQIKSLNLESQVSMVGHQSQADVAMLYASSQTLVMPSTNEVWGLVANEALASGMHVIVSDVCGVAELIDGMQGAYICGVKVESIASQMQKSKSEWNGRIANPEIMGYTPERFADSIIEACLRI
jgi:glycosyltransferase involved in cell wall biosynthesis